MIDVILLEKSKQYPSYSSPSVHTALGEDREMGIIALHQPLTELSRVGVEFDNILKLKSQKQVHVHTYMDSFPQPQHFFCCSSRK